MEAKKAPAKGGKSKVEGKKTSTSTGALSQSQTKVGEKKKKEVEENPFKKLVEI